MRKKFERFQISALKSRGFRRYALIQLLSSTSVSAQRTAELWLVYQITGEGLSIGISTAVRTAPALFLAGLAGVLADRFSRKSLLTISQAGRGVLSALFVLITVGREYAEVSIVWVYLLVFALGCVGGIDQPVRRATVRDVVRSSDLPGAASLHTATISTGRVIGPLCAGGLMTWVGAPAAFIFSAVAAFASAAFVRSLVLLSRSERATKGDVAVEPEPAQAQDSSEASPRVTKTPKRARVFSPQLRPTYLMLAAYSLFGMNIEVVFPLIADNVLSGGEGTFASLVTLMSAGAVAGSLFTATRARETTNNSSLVWALVYCGAALISVAAGTSYALIALTVIAAGVGTGVFLSLTSASIQTGATQSVQGRQAGLYSVIFVGGRAVGAPVMGWVADNLDARPTVVVISLGTLLAAVVAFALIPEKGLSRPGWLPSRAGGGR